MACRQMTSLLLNACLKFSLQWSTDSALCDTNGPNMNGAVADVKEGLKAALKRESRLQMRRELSTACGAETEQPSQKENRLIF